MERLAPPAALGVQVVDARWTPPPLSGFWSEEEEVDAQAEHPGGGQRVEGDHGLGSLQAIGLRERRAGAGEHLEANRRLWEMWTRVNLESELYDVQGLIGRATQSLAVRSRAQ